MIKGWYTKHEDKWHQIEDVKDTGKPAHEKGGGNVVKLKGKDDWIHASELSGMEPKEPTMKKTEYKDQLKGGMADKKKPSDFDQEQLEIGTKHEMEHTGDHSKAREIAMDHLAEDPKYYEKLKEIEKYDRIDEKADGKREFDYGKEELNKRWGNLKKAVLDNKSSIMAMEDQEFNDEEEGGDENDTGGSAPESPNAISGEEPTQDSEEGEAPENATEEGSDQGAPDPEEIEQMLREEGYSDAEIAHIIHGHIMPESTVDDIKMDAEQQMSNHKMDHQKRMDDLDYNLASQEHETNSLDRDHKSRMLELEYQYAQKEKEMELKYKEKELELKLKQQEQKAADRAKEAKMKASDKSRSMDAAKTSKKEREGK